MTLRQRCLAWWGSAVEHIKDVSLRAAYRIGVSLQSHAEKTPPSANVEPLPFVESRRPLSMQFSDHPLYVSLAKHLAVPRLFKFSNPFYRCHDAQNGVETVMAGKTYLNFASYDYLGLNQHSAVRKAAKEAIDRYGASVSASRSLQANARFTAVSKRSWRLSMKRRVPSRSSADMPPTFQQSAR